MSNTIKALTIHQPFAHLIVTPQSDLPVGAIQKRVENRRWNTMYRGALLIHAGKSLEWMDEEDYPPAPEKEKLAYNDFPEMAFGAIVGIVDLLATIPIKSIRNEKTYLGTFEWLRDHHHAEGPVCWVILNPVKFETPIPYRGQRGLFDIPLNIVQEQMANAQ